MWFIGNMHSWKVDGGLWLKPLETLTLGEKSKDGLLDSFELKTRMLLVPHGALLEMIINLLQNSRNCWENPTAS